MKPLPTLSIIIPSFNQADFLAQALDSLEQQEYPALEVIVIDGGSVDGTVELLKTRTEVVSHWVSEADAGQTQALNKGFRLASGQIFGWLNCDERYRSGTLRRVGETFAAFPGLEIVFGHRIVVDPEGQEICRMRSPAIHPGNYALFANGLLFSDATFWTADLHRCTGELDEIQCRHYAMDFDWFGRLGLNTKRWKRLDEYLSEFTEHENRITKDVPEMPEIALRIRQRLHRLAGVGPLRVVLLSPIYFILSRYGRFGWRGLFRLPRLSTLPRCAGLSR